MLFLYAGIDRPEAKRQKGGQYDNQRIKRQSSICKGYREITITKRIERRGDTEVEVELRILRLQGFLKYGSRLLLRHCARNGPFVNGDLSKIF